MLVYYHNKEVIQTAFITCLSQYAVDITHGIVFDIPLYVLTPR